MLHMQEQLLAVNENPGKVWIRKPHSQNLSCYIASANPKFHGGTETADLPCQSTILSLPHMCELRLNLHF